jgi:hypothetical protein
VSFPAVAAAAPAAGHGVIAQAVAALAPAGFVAPAQGAPVVSADGLGGPSLTVVAQAQAGRSHRFAYVAKESATSPDAPSSDPRVEALERVLDEWDSRPTAPAGGVNGMDAAFLLDLVSRDTPRQSVALGRALVAQREAGTGQETVDTSASHDAWSELGAVTAGHALIARYGERRLPGKDRRWRRSALSKGR